MELNERVRRFNALLIACRASADSVKTTNFQLLNALLYVVEHGCKWRGLPSNLAIGIRSTRG